MFSIYDGRESFYQWDLDRKLVVEDSSIKEVHFCNRTDDCSLVVETYAEDGLTLANVPNILLQSDWRINVYAYDGKATKHSATFGVISRTKPSDYVYTETEVKSYEDLEKRVEHLERSGGGGGSGAMSASAYLTQVVDEIYSCDENPQTIYEWISSGYIVNIFVDNAEEPIFKPTYCEPNAIYCSYTDSDNVLHTLVINNEGAYLDTQELLNEVRVRELINENMPPDGDEEGY